MIPAVGIAIKNKKAVAGTAKNIARSIAVKMDQFTMNKIGIIPFINKRIIPEDLNAFAVGYKQLVIVIEITAGPHVHGIDQLAVPEIPPNGVAIYFQQFTLKYDRVHIMIAVSMPVKKAGLSVDDFIYVAIIIPDIQRTGIIVAHGIDIRSGGQQWCRSRFYDCIANTAITPVVGKRPDTMIAVFKEIKIGIIAQAVERGKIDKVLTIEPGNAFIGGDPQETATIGITVIHRITD